MVPHFLRCATNNRSLALREHMDKITQKMLVLCRLTPRLTIHIGIAQNRIGQTILACIVAHIPLSSDLTNIRGTPWAEQHFLCDRKLLRIDTPIETIATRSKNELAHQCTYTAIQHIQQTTYMYISIR